MAQRYNNDFRDDDNLIHHEEAESQEWKQQSYQGNQKRKQQSSRQENQNENQNWNQWSRHNQEDELINYEELESQRWKKQTNHRREDEFDDNFTNNSNAPTTLPDEVWLMPVMDDTSTKNVSLLILGRKNENLNRIQKLTDTSMVYNEQKAQIEMWGSNQGLEEALKQWSAIAQYALENVLIKKPRNKWGRQKQEEEEPQESQKPNETSRVEGPWAKPNKAPRNLKEEEKLKRREERRLEEESYKKLPDPKARFQFQGNFIFPKADFPINIYFGDDTLDPLRVETKCHIWHEPTPESSGHYLIRIVGNSCESVELATTRVKNLLIRVYQSRNAKSTIYHMMEPPQKPFMVKMVDPQFTVNLPVSVKLTKSFKLLKPDYLGELNSNFDEFQNIRESNTETFRDSIIKAFETIHLFDQEIKMRIRFGHVCLTTYPNPDKEQNVMWTVERLNLRVLKSTRVQSEFATCVATGEEQLNSLSKILDENELKWGNPYREFKICVNRNIPKSKESKEKGKVPCVFMVEFDKVKNDGKNGRKDDGMYEGKFGLWKVTMNIKNVLDIRMVHLENDYSWKLDIQVARRLPNEDAQTVQKQFISTLRICPNGRLVYSNTKDIEVVSVCEKTKKKYWWKADYVVEITKYEFWDLADNGQNRTGIEFLLSAEKPPKVTYGITLYKKSWDDDFIANSSLRVGEVPDWHPHDFLFDESKDLDSLLSDIRTFLELIQSSKSIENEEYDTLI